MKRTKKRASRGGTNQHLDYITLYRRYGKEAVEAEEILLDEKYPVAFGKANPLRRIKILDQFLSKKEEE